MAERRKIKTRALIVDTPSPQPSRIFKNVDGIRFLLHEGGCGGTREDSNNLCGLIAGYIHHPNVGGSDSAQSGVPARADTHSFRDELRKRNPRFDKPLVILEQQKSGTEAAMLTEAIRKTFSRPDGSQRVPTNKCSTFPACVSD